MIEVGFLARDTDSRLASSLLVAKKKRESVDKHANGNTSDLDK